MNPNQAHWEKGDPTPVAAAMRASGEALVKEFGITPGLKVFDLGCGAGTTALPAETRLRKKQNGACLDLPTRRYVGWDG